MMKSSEVKHFISLKKSYNNWNLGADFPIHFNSCHHYQRKSTHHFHLGMTFFIGTSNCNYIKYDSPNSMVNKL